MGPAAQLIEREENFRQGTLYRDRHGKSCMRGRGQFPAIYDCLGAFMWAYRKLDPNERHVLARQLFAACRARHGHARLGHLDWEESLDLLKGCGL